MPRLRKDLIARKLGGWNHRQMRTKRQLCPYCGRGGGNPLDQGHSAVEGKAYVARHAYSCCRCGGLWLHIYRDGMGSGIQGVRRCD